LWLKAKLGLSGRAALLLHEAVSLFMIAVTLGIILCVIGSKRFAH
jgi:hypothetical protein